MHQNHLNHMLQNYGEQQIKNIPFLLWKCLHVERRERKRQSPCVSEHQQGESRKGGGERRAQNWLRLDLNILINGLSQELTRCCLKSAHRRKTKLTRSLTLLVFLTRFHRISGLFKWLQGLQYKLFPNTRRVKVYIELTRIYDI